MDSKKLVTHAQKLHMEVKQEREVARRKLEEKCEAIEFVKQTIERDKGKCEMNVLDLKDRDQTLEEKRYKILDLKKKIQELEKFKFVLDYKIKELKRDIGPREV